MQPSEPSASAPATKPAIELRGLRREFGERVALRGVTLSVGQGETLAVQGPNGSGKTTLLRVLGGLLRPTIGVVHVLGCELPREGWRLRGHVGWLGHDALLYRDLSARENLRFAAALHGLDPEPAKERIGSLLEAVGLARRGDDRVRDYSRGMVQRAAVCRAVLHEPELLLLDEPLSHLDAEARELVEPLIGAAPGRTRVLVTHEADGAATADALLELGAGGRPLEVAPA